MATCPACKGQGMVLKYMQMGPMTMQVQSHCDKCGGQGSWIEKKCDKCSGRKVVNQGKQMTAQIERGMTDGEEILFSREAEQFPGYVPGDFVFIIKQTPHPVFERIGDNLYADVEITLQEALLGFHKTLKHLNGEDVVVERDEVTQPFQTIVLAGLGMSIKGSSKHGDMHVTIKVKIPQMSIEESKELSSILTDSS